MQLSVVAVAYAVAVVDAGTRAGTMSVGVKIESEDIHSAEVSAATNSNSLARKNFIGPADPPAAVARLRRDAWSFSEPPGAEALKGAPFHLFGVGFVAARECRRLEERQ